MEAPQSRPGASLPLCAGVLRLAWLFVHLSVPPLPLKGAETEYRFGRA